MDTASFALSQPKQTFRVRAPLPMLRPAFFACLFAFGVVFLVSEPETRGIVSLVLGGVLLFSLALCYWLLSITRLEISPDGIVYHAIGYRVRSSWGNIEGVARRLQGAVELDCLILREPGIELSGWMRLSYQILPLINVISLFSGHASQPDDLHRYESVIPVEAFDKNWYSGEIGSLIKRYAPQAYETALS